MYHFEWAFNERLNIKYRKRAFQGYPMIDHCYDVVIVGAGGAGLRAAFGLGKAIQNIVIGNKNVCALEFKQNVDLEH